MPEQKAQGSEFHSAKTFQYDVITLCRSVSHGHISSDQS